MTVTMKLNEEQQSAVEHLEGPLLVLAGAGSGKTRVVTNRIAHLLEEGIAAERILAVTFTNKAAQEMKERVHQQVQQHVLITTFHSLGARLLRESIHHLGYRSDFTIYDQDDSLKLIKTCLEDVDSTAKDKAKQAKALQAAISRYKNDLQGPDDISYADLTSATEQLLPEVFKRYQSRLKDCQAVDFDDLLLLPVRLFKEHAVALEFYQRRWQYLLVDEYQDTNSAQYEFIRLLAGERQNLFVVGDPDQSIYSWRGADMSNILNFERDYPGAKVVRLEQNYRSRELILQAANALIGHNPNRYEKNLWSDRTGNERIQLYRAYNEHEEAEFVASSIRDHYDQGCSLLEIAVFYRTNFQSRLFEDIFLRYRIPYVIVGGMSFYQRKEIKDILAYLRVVQSSADFVSFARTINLPKRGIGDTSLGKMRLAAERSGLPILEFCERVIQGDPEIDFRLGARQKAGVKEYVELIHELRQLAQQDSLKDLVEATASRSGYLGFLAEDPDTLDDRKQNVQELIAKASEWDETEEGVALEAFLEELSLKSNLDGKGVGEDCVHLMTMHNGKGLEFETVFLVGLEEGLFPHMSALDDPSELEEERRLCYVGMTRAKDHLYLTSTLSRNLWGTHRPMTRSRFIGEIPRKYLEEV